MSSTYTAPVVHADIKAFTAIWPPTSDVAREAVHRPQSPLRTTAPSPTPAQATSSLVAFASPPAFADLVADFAGLGQGAADMTSSYRSRAEATDDRACLKVMGEALNAAHNAVRLDECRLWTVRGSRGYVSAWDDGQTWMLAVGSETPRHWTFAKQRMASFPGLAQLTQDGDEAGVFRLMRLPTPKEAAEIRRAAGVRQSPGSTSAGRRFTPTKTGDTATSMRLAGGRYMTP